MADAIALEDRLQAADLVVTGEGLLDAAGHQPPQVLTIISGMTLVAAAASAQVSWLRSELGEAVSEYALYDGLTPRVAYVDGGDLYEAMAPGYQPTRRAEGACAPRYGAAICSLASPRRPCLPGPVGRQPRRHA